jgi:hypothetical protein
MLRVLTVYGVNDLINFSYTRSNCGTVRGGESPAEKIDSGKGIGLSAGC